MTFLHRAVAPTCSRRNARWLLLQSTGLAPARRLVTLPQPRCQVWLVASSCLRRPSSRPCSTDKSVASCRHCWQHLARYSLGLCSPSRSSRTCRSGLASATASAPGVAAARSTATSTARSTAPSGFSSSPEGLLSSPLKSARNPETPSQNRTLARICSSTRVEGPKSTRASCPLSPRSEE